jgi:flagellar protein FlgJ
MIPEDFIKNYYQFAKDTEQEYNIPALITLAQAALESAWGEKAPGNNFFGIRAGSSWKGKTVSITTHEEINGELVKQNQQAFRAYGSAKASFEDHAYIILHAKNPNGSLIYSKCFQSKDEYEWATNLEECGYSTSSNYSEVLSDVINSIKKRL